MMKSLTVIDLSVVCLVTILLIIMPIVTTVGSGSGSNVRRLIRPNLTVSGGHIQDGSEQCPLKSHCHCRLLYEGLKVNCTGVNMSLVGTILSHVPSNTIKLDLMNGNVDQFPTGSLVNLTGLNSLYLTNNLISNLRKLFVSIPTTIKQNLTHLDLSNNRVRHLYDNMSLGFDHLHTLVLNGNRLIELKADYFWGFNKLVILYLGDNLLKSLRANTFHHLNRLQHLHLYRNNLNEIESDAFSGLDLLIILHIEGNKIRGMTPGTLGPLTNLTTLFLGNNLLEKFDRCLLEAPQLTSLYLSNNSIKIIDSSISAINRRFRFISLDNNQLSTINSSFINILENAFQVNLDNNPWSCDCKLLSLVKWIRSRFETKSEAASDDGSNLTCNSPSNLRGNIIKTIPWTQFKCGDYSFRAELCLKGISENSTSSNRKKCLNLKERICSLSSGSSTTSCLCDHRIEQCHVCPEYSYGDHDVSATIKCLPCPSLTTGGYGARRSSDCRCDVGFESAINANDQTTFSCLECPLDFYKSDVGSDKCLPCPRGSRSKQIASASCQCLRGFYRPPKSINCLECPSGTYKDVTGQGYCTKCPRYFISPRGSTALDNCTCPFNVLTQYPVICFPPRAEIGNPVEKNAETIVVLVVVFGSLTGIAIAIAFLLFYQFSLHGKSKKHKEIKFKMDSILRNLGGSLSSRVPENGYICNENWNGLMVDPSQVQFEQILGQGAFGQVHRAIVTGLKNVSGSTTVAIKSLREGHSIEEKDALYTELQQLIYVGQHPNIINLLGFISSEDTMMLIIEYAVHGDLLSYLRKKKMDTAYASLQFSCQSSTTSGGGYTNSYSMPMRLTGSNATTEMDTTTMITNLTNTSGSTLTDHSKSTNADEDNIDVLGLLTIAWQVAKGMNHLAHMKCIHRDLAARNVLLSDGKVAKVSDFGLARAVYECGYYFKETKGRLPFKWMPMEAIIEGQYTTKSDVWSFGILLWELFTLGGNPYPGVPMNSLLDLLQSGYRMAKPNNCPQQVFEIMHKCWRERAADRPSFQELSDMLDSVIQQTANLVPAEYMQIDDGIGLAGERTVTVNDGDGDGGDPDQESLYDLLTETSSLMSEVPSSNGPTKSRLIGPRVSSPQSPPMSQPQPMQSLSEYTRMSPMTIIQPHHQNLSLLSPHYLSENG